MFSDNIRGTERRTAYPFWQCSRDLFLVTIRHPRLRICSLDCCVEWCSIFRSWMYECTFFLAHHTTSLVRLEGETLLSLPYKYFRQHFGCGIICAMIKLRIVIYMWVLCKYTIVYDGVQGTPMYLHGYVSFATVGMCTVLRIYGLLKKSTIVFMHACINYIVIGGFLHKMQTNHLVISTCTFAYTPLYEYEILMRVAAQTVIKKICSYTSAVRNGLCISVHL